MSWVKWAVTLLAAVAVLLGIGFFVFGDQLKRAVYQNITSDMFVLSDDDGFDPGLPIGAVFPNLETTLGELSVRDVGPLVGDRGMIFIASRSIDW